MRSLYLCTAALAIVTLSGSSLLACGSNEPPQPVEQQQYVPQSPPSAQEGLRLAGAGLGGAIVAGSIAWSVARRKV